MDKCCKVSGDLQLQFFNIFKHCFPNITWEVYLLVLHITLISMSKYTLLEYPINQEKDFFFSILVFKISYFLFIDLSTCSCQEKNTDSSK